ncbi:MAG: hypothetical protein PHO14_06010 [Kiritimatiellae bacterium]|nr:hypothetical protein [Kiritimatiellia bacterium]MDD4341773.1 hypothetical protein [Kiritimatiellia bacterium]
MRPPILFDVATQLEFPTNWEFALLSDARKAGNEKKFKKNLSISNQQPPPNERSVGFGVGFRVGE